MKLNLKSLYLSTLCLLIILGMSVSAVLSYETLGGSWTSTDVRDLDWLVKSGIDNYWDIRYAVDDATSSWNDVVESGCPDFDRVTSNELVYILDKEETNGPLAETLNSPDWTSTYNYSRIWVNQYWLDELYYESPEHLQSVMAHELGHTLGLNHENDYGAIVLLYWTDLSYLDNGIYEPVLDDINGVDSIYG